MIPGTALSKVEKVYHAAKRLCHFTSPNTSYAAGAITPPLVDAIQELRHAIAGCGEDFASEWKYEVVPVSVVGIDDAWTIKATSKEGKQYGLRTNYGAKRDAELFIEGLDLDYQPVPGKSWEMTGLHGKNYYREFSDPYEFLHPED